MAGPFTPTIVCPILIGRAPHLDALVQLTEQACDGQGRIILVTGEAGIGKSRLVAELKARVATPQARTAPGAVQVLEGHCYEPDAAFPYAPVLDALRAFLATRPTADGAASVGPAAIDLVTLVPELFGSAPDRVSHTALELVREKRRLFQALTRFVIGLAVTQPMLLLIEDVHQDRSASRIQS